MSEYTVRSGDTLSQIAAANDVSLAKLLEFNPQFRANPNLIHPGDVVRFDSAARSQAVAASVTGAAAPTAASNYDGGSLNRVQLAQLFHQAGFRGENLVKMVAISMRESGGNPRAFNGNTATGDQSYGLTQINMLGRLGPARRQRLGLTSNEQLFDPLTNARAAFILSNNGTDLSPWGAYKGRSNTYGTDMGAARAAVAQAQGLLGQPFQNGVITSPAAVPALNTAPAAVSQPVLRNGARGEHAAELQRQLQAAGFSPGPIDGWFGPQTEAAVRRFQASRGITVDGIVGPQTWGKLLEGPASKPLLREGARGTAVSNLQRRLQAAGHSSGPIDGWFGPQTAAAVRGFQASRGITVDGIVGPQTWGKLLGSAPPVETPPETPPPTGPTPVTNDPATNQRIEQLHPAIRTQVAQFVNRVERELGIQLRVTSGFRSFAEQDELYAQGRTTPGDIVTNARAGQSYHNYGLSIDVVELNPDGSVNWNTDWEAIGAIGESMGFEWGGNWQGFTDRPHFQMNFGHHWSELLERRNSGDTTDGYVNVD